MSQALDAGKRPAGRAPSAPTTKRAATASITAFFGVAAVNDEAGTSTSRPSRCAESSRPAPPEAPGHPAACGPGAAGLTAWAFAAQWLGLVDAYVDLARLRELTVSLTPTEAQKAFEECNAAPHLRKKPVLVVDGKVRGSKGRNPGAFEISFFCGFKPFTIASDISLFNMLQPSQPTLHIL